MREWYLILIGCCKATTGCNQGSSGGSTTQQSAPISVGSLVNREVCIFPWQLKLYHLLFIVYSLIESTFAFFWHILLGFHLTILSHNNSRIQPLERALPLNKRCWLLHFFQFVLMLPPPREVLKYIKGSFLRIKKHHIRLFATKTLLNYHVWILTFKIRAAQNNTGDGTFHTFLKCKIFIFKLRCT